MRTVLFLLSLFSISILYGQDTLIKKNGEIIRAKILEVGTEEIKFKVFGETDSPVIIVKNSDVKVAKVSGQYIINNQAAAAEGGEDQIIKKNGDLLKVKVVDIGTEEVKFRLLDSPDGPTITLKKSEIRSMKVNGQLVIDNKRTGPDEDVILKMDGTTIKAKVVDLGTQEVQYKLYNNPEGPTLRIKKSEVRSVKIEGQVVYEYKPDPYSISNNAILDKNSSLKFHFFSPLSHHLAFSWEWMNKPGFNWETGLGIIGPGTSPWDKGMNITPKGLFLRVGPKFLLGNSSEIEIEGARYAHPLKGKYFKVEATLGALTTRQTQDTGSFGSPWGVGTISFTTKYQYFVFNLIYGRQFIFGNTITVGYYAGLGYGFESKSTSGTKPNNWWYSDFNPRRYSYWYMGRDFPMTITAGFSIGYIFRTPDWLSGRSAGKSSSKPPTRRSMDE